MDLIQTGFILKTAKIYMMTVIDNDDLDIYL